MYVSSFFIEHIACVRLRLGFRLLTSRFLLNILRKSNNLDNFLQLHEMNSKGYDARSVTNRLLLLARQEERWFTPLQILKLVYYCQGWGLAIFDTRLFYQEIQAWRYGPVIPAIYHAAKKYVDGPITEQLDAQKANFDEQDIALIEAVYLKYGKYTGKQLITLTHKPGTPWDQIWSIRTTDHDVIPIEVIQDYFVKLKG